MMAKRYALVPESWLQQNNVPYDGNGNLITFDSKEERHLSHMADILPQKLRNKARMLLHYIDGKIKLDDRERIVYNDNHVGSYIIDLVRYYVSPFVKTRPLDAPRFEALLNEIGVPSSAIARSNVSLSGQSNDILANWKQF